MFFTCVCFLFEVKIVGFYSTWKAMKHCLSNIWMHNNLRTKHFTSSVWLIVLVAELCLTSRIQWGLFFKNFKHIACLKQEIFDKEYFAAWPNDQRRFQMFDKQFLSVLPRPNCYIIVNYDSYVFSITRRLALYFHIHILYSD